MGSLEPYIFNELSLNNLFSLPSTALTPTEEKAGEVIPEIEARPETETRVIAVLHPVLNFLQIIMVLQSTGVMKEGSWNKNQFSKTIAIIV